MHSVWTLRPDIAASDSTSRTYQCK
jgi:hypothetical protein